jgi:predicted TIM-barrel fold metal-dependent hydrolase
MAVDAHAQIGTGEIWHEPKRRVDYRVEHFLDRASEAGISRLCVMAPQSDSYKEANLAVARVCARYPGRLIPFAVHHSDREAGSAGAAIREEVRAKGVRGIKVEGHPTREILDAAAELSIPVMYYPAMAPGAGPARYFHMIASAYPTVSFILPHLGSYRSRNWWAHIETIDLVKRYSNVYVETSGVAYHEFLEQAMRELPPEKILFGSFAPELDPRVEIHLVRLFKSRNEEAVLGGNILRLLKPQGLRP